MIFPDRLLELVGSSEKGVDDAIQKAISRASKTIREMKWFEVVQTRGHIEKDLINMVLHFSCSGHHEPPLDVS
jgi:flavin-binding protein dodecin